MAWVGGTRTMGYHAHCDTSDTRAFRFRTTNGHRKRPLPQSSLLLGRYPGFHSGRRASTHPSRMRAGRRPTIGSTRKAAWRRELGLRTHRRRSANGLAVSPSEEQSWTSRPDGRGAPGRQTHSVRRTERHCREQSGEQTQEGETCVY